MKNMLTTIFAFVKRKWLLFFSVLLVSCIAILLAIIIPVYFTKPDIPVPGYIDVSILSGGTVFIRGDGYTMAILPPQPFDGIELSKTLQLHARRLDCVVVPSASQEYLDGAGVILANFTCRSVVLPSKVSKDFLASLSEKYPDLNVSSLGYRKYLQVGDLLLFNPSFGSDTAAVEVIHGQTKFLVSPKKVSSSDEFFACILSPQAAAGSKFKAEKVYVTSLTMPETGEAVASDISTVSLLSLPPALTILDDGVEEPVIADF